MHTRQSNQLRTDERWFQRQPSLRILSDVTNEPNSQKVLESHIHDTFMPRGSAGHSRVSHGFVLNSYEGMWHMEKHGKTSKQKHPTSRHDILNTYAVCNHQEAQDLAIHPVTWSGQRWLLHISSSSVLRNNLLWILHMYSCSALWLLSLCRIHVNSVFC